jgi:hypothetical protein
MSILHHLLNVTDLQAAAQYGCPQVAQQAPITYVLAT